jgi:predicted permease
LINNFLFSLNVIAPVFVLISVGYFSKQLKFINENFVSVTSRFAFNISLPILIFLQVQKLNFEQAIDLKIIIYIYIATIISFVSIWIISVPIIKSPRDRSSFVQGAFRSNFAIIGFAIISSLFGREILGKAAIILAFILPLYNVLAVIVLSSPEKSGIEFRLKEMIKEILLNPLIIAVFVGLIFSVWKIKLPQPLYESAKLLSDLALPLALIGIGGSLSLNELRKAPALAVSSSIIKIIVLPVVLTPLAYLLSFKGDDLVILFILFASPTAIVSFIMAEAMGANGKLAGDIVLISTIGSVLTFSLGLTILKTLGLF